MDDSEFLHVNHVTVYSKEKDKNEKFRLAKVFQNGMELQSAPEEENIFGFAPFGTFVTATIIKNGERHDMGNVTVAVESCLKGTWSLNIGAWEAGSDYSIEITNSGQGIQTQTILLESVSFGFKACLTVESASSVFENNPWWGPEQALTEISNGWIYYWHSNTIDINPSITFKMQREHEVRAVEVVDRQDCCDEDQCDVCNERFQSVEVRVGSTPSFDDAQSCGIQSYEGEKRYRLVY